jgi:cobalt-zinc-cadmium efflux system membrane fusion protein
MKQSAPCPGLLLLFALSCVVGPSSTDAGATPAATPRIEAPDAHQDEQEHAGLPTKIRLPPDVVVAARIQTAAAKMEQLPLTVALAGEVAADPDRSAQVAARVPGRIVDVRFKEGASVKKGELLAVVESPDAGRARAAARATEAKALALRQNADRLKGLAAKGLAAGQEVKTAEAEATSLEAEAAAARETLRAFGAAGGSGIARLEVRAPLSGVVLTRDAVVGQTVPADHVIASLADLDEAYFLGRLFEKDLARAEAGARTEVRLNAYPKEVFEGVVESIGKQLDPAARTVAARIRVRDRGGRLKVGLFGTALVEEVGTTSTEARLAVPASAVTQVADRDVVFVRQPDGDFEMHPVTLGRSATGRVEVLAGLRPGELVVVEGAFTLKSAVLKSSFGEEGE